MPGASAVSNDVVISQVYGGGGNAGATLTHDFIELFNRGSAPIDLTNWSVQYASSTGSTWQATPLSGTLQPGQYYLVQQAAGAGGTQPLPMPDATGSISMGGTSGKVALVTNATLLTCGGATRCLPNPAIRDLVGYGAAYHDFEGTGPTPAPSNTTAVARAQAGCTRCRQQRRRLRRRARPRPATRRPRCTCAVIPRRGHQRDARQRGRGRGARRVDHRRLQRAGRRWPPIGSAWRAW